MKEHAWKALAVIVSLFIALCCILALATPIILGLAQPDTPIDELIGGFLVAAPSPTKRPTPTFADSRPPQATHTYVPQPSRATPTPAPFGHNDLWEILYEIMLQGPYVPLDDTLLKGEFETTDEYESRIEPIRSSYAAAADKYYREQIGSMRHVIAWRVEELPPYDASNELFPEPIVCSGSPSSHPYVESATLHTCPSWQGTPEWGVPIWGMGGLEVERSPALATVLRYFRYPNVGNEFCGHFSYVIVILSAPMPVENAREVRQYADSGELWVLIYLRLDFPHAFEGYRLLMSPDTSRPHWRWQDNRAWQDDGYGGRVEVIFDEVAFVTEDGRQLYAWR